MPETLINIITFLFFIGAAYWAYTLMPNIQEKIIPEGLGYCFVDSHCVVFGETGDYNCGCYNKNYLPLKVEEKGSCLAPTSCKCVEGQCKGVFGEINNFDDCANAGYIVVEGYPRQCQVLQKSFTEDHCVKEDAENVLTLSDAKEIAINSECGNNLKETFICNEITGTYWIDLNLEKEGCSPACVVDIKNRTASINWRCMGLIE